MKSSPGLQCHLVVMFIHCTVRLWSPRSVEGYQGLEGNSLDKGI